MTQVISYWDDTQKKYIEVSTTDPLPTNAIGGGSGGAEEVEITSANGAAKTVLGNSDALPGTDVGLLTNDRNYAFNGASWDRVHGGAGDADQILTTAGLGFKTVGLNYFYNGVSWDRVRNNTEGTLIASSTHTTTQSTPTQTNFNSKGVILYLNITANPGGVETLSINFHYVDPVTGGVTTIIASFTTAAAVNGLYTLHLYPGASTTPDDPNNNKSYSLPLPRQWQAAIAHSAAGSWTYSLGYSLIS